MLRDCIGGGPLSPLTLDYTQLPCCELALDTDWLKRKGGADKQVQLMWRICFISVYHLRIVLSVGICKGLQPLQVDQALTDSAF